METTQGLERRLRVEIPAERIQGEIDKRLRKLAKVAKVPGFRPGKVSIKVVAQRYGPEVRKEAIEEMIKNSFIDALEQEKLSPAATPHIEMDTDAGLDTGLRYVATFDVMPEISLSPFESIVVARPMATVAAADIDRMLETLRLRRREWKTVDRAATPDDRVVVSYECIVNGEPLPSSSATELPIELDTKAMVDGFEECLVGTRADEDKVLELTLPANYPQQIASKPATFNVKVHRVEEPILPDLDDTFAKSWGVEEGGIEALRSEVGANLERELADGLSTVMKQRLMEALLAGNELVLPESLVRVEIERMVTHRREELKHSGIDPEHIELEPTAFEAPARKLVSLGLIIAEIIRVHRIELDPARLDARIEMMAATYQDPAEAMQWYRSDSERLSRIGSAVLEDQAVEWLLERVRVIDEPASFDQIMNHGQTRPEAAQSGGVE